MALPTVQSDSSSRTLKTETFSPMSPVAADEMEARRVMEARAGAKPRFSRKLALGAVAGLACVGAAVGAVVATTGSASSADSSESAETVETVDMAAGPNFWWLFGGNDCQEVTARTDIDLDEWVRASWYVQQQQVVNFQPVESNYCVMATYEFEAATVPFFSGDVVSVYNYANTGGVNGAVNNPTANRDDALVLCARLPDTSKTGELLVAPCWLPNLFGGDYWIVGVGGDVENGYDWAVVSGGQPNEVYDDGCTTKVDSYFNSGLWIFSRDPVLSADKLADAQDFARAQGFTLSQLNDVVQEGCTYDQAFIKPDERPARY